MKYALIKNCVVVNTIIVDPAHLAGLSVDADALVSIDELPVGPGWLYENDEFKAPSLPDLEE